MVWCVIQERLWGIGFRKDSVLGIANTVARYLEIVRGISQQSRNNGNHCTTIQKQRLKYYKVKLMVKCIWYQILERAIFYS